jgi:predicted Rossmann fold flavoprotein
LKKQNQNFDVIVIGGGASGMMASCVAAQNGARVLLFEKNKNLGEKLKITGGGRCNITNAEEDVHLFLKKYGTDGQSLYSAFAKFGMKETFAFFESRQLPLVVQGEKRVFPKTERALDVFRVLEKSLVSSNVSIQSESQVVSIDQVGGHITSVTTREGKYSATNYILATGGQSHPETGSTGDGFGWLKDLGHTIVPPTPSIVPLAVKERWVKSLAGVSIPEMRITFFVDSVRKFQKTGRILFTHFGVSGPLILNSAKKVSDLLHEGAVTASIDLFPGIDHKTFEKKIIDIFDDNKNKMLKNVFDQIVPLGTKDAILSLLPKINGDTKVHSITKVNRKSIMDLLRALPLTITGLMGFDRAVVADGGVALSEINTKTMQSKLFSNLYITGDLLHINRPSGGYSLQLCWTTGFVAGNHSSGKM